MPKGLSWFGQYGQLRQDQFSADLAEKPALGFAFDNLLFDPEMGLAFKVVNGAQSPLTPEEAAACAAFVDRELAEGEYAVHLWREDYVYAGSMPQRQAREEGRQFTLATPDHPASIYNPRLGQWEPIKAIICEQGNLIIDPAGPVEAPYGLFLTAQQWRDFPKPEGFPSVYRWSYTKEQWVDGRDLEQEKGNVRNELEGCLEMAGDALFGRRVTMADVCRWAAGPDRSELTRYSLIQESLEPLRSDYAGRIERAASLPDLDELVREFRLVLADPPQEPSAEAGSRAMEAAARLRLDEFARTRGYDDAATCVALYRGCQNPVYAAEAEYLQGATVRTWEYATAVLNQVKNGEREAGGLEAFEAGLAEAVPLCWPTPEQGGSHG